MDPSFFEIQRLRTPWIPPTIHLVHRTENHSEIIFFDVLEKLFVLFIKFTGSNVSRTEIIWRNGDVINFIFSQFFIQLVHHIFYMFASRIKDE